MNLAFCYENVDPARGGCETYISDFIRRLASDGHEVHLYASRWNERCLPASLKYHTIHRPRAPRFLRPWLFGRACRRAMAGQCHDVSIGFDKTWGQDVLYPQGGIYAASVEANLAKHGTAWMRQSARMVKSVDLAVQSYLALERRQYQHSRPMALIVNSDMVRLHAGRHLQIDQNIVHVVHAAVHPDRFGDVDRTVLRSQIRNRWQVEDSTCVGLFVAMNYRLKGLEPLLRSLQLIAREAPFRLVVVGNPNYSRYQHLARRLGVDDRVIFHGFCGDSRSVYFASDFLVHPTFYDPCSLVVLEALACGLPVITSKFNGASELLHPPHGGLVVDNPHNFAQLTAAITRMLDRNYREASSKHARESARLWTFDDHYRKMMAILESVAARKRASGQSSRAA